MEPTQTFTTASLLRDRADDDKVGLRFEDAAWTWREVVRESARRAAMLGALRRSGPFHIGVLLENVPEYLFLAGGAAFAGATIVGINPTRRCLLYTSPSPRDGLLSRMPSSA